MEQTRFNPENEDYAIAQRGIAEFISEILKSKSTDSVINKTLIDEMIVRLDEKISHQVDEILHNEKFQEMESAWRGLKLLVERTDFRENIKIEAYISMFILLIMVNLVVSQLQQLSEIIHLRHLRQILSYYNMSHLLARCPTHHLFQLLVLSFLV